MKKPPERFFSLKKGLSAQFLGNTLFRSSNYEDIFQKTGNPLQVDSEQDKKLLSDEKLFFSDSLIA